MTADSWYYLPFIPGFNNSGYLDTKTISANATRENYNADTDPGLMEYYLHNSNGHLAVKLVQDIFVNKAKLGLNSRPVILSDSTWAGSGQYAVGLITNIGRTWAEMKSTISMAMGLSMFGFSNIMVDACGTKGKLD